MKFKVLISSWAIVLLVCGASWSQDSFVCDLTQEYDMNLLQFFGPENPTLYCRRDESGVRITIPKEAQLKSCGIAARFLMQGDFEVTGEYKIINLPKPDAGFGAGITLVVRDEQGEVASLQRVHQKRGHTYVAHRGKKDRDGKVNHSVWIHDAEAPSGKVQIRRIGGKLEYRVLDGTSGAFAQIWDRDFPTGDISLIHFGAQTGEAPALVDVAWTRIEVTAEKIFFAPASFSSYWIVWLLLTVGVLGGISIVGVRWRKKRQMP